MAPTAHDISTRQGSEEDITSSSHVRLVGRLGARVELRTLPSGDEVTVFTVIVDRSPKDRSRTGGRGATVDSIACQTFRAGVIRRLSSLDAGTWVEAEGTLRRRFWRTGGGLSSAMEVDVIRLERCRVRA
jgi:single-strand DNA-binding protein